MAGRPSTPPSTLMDALRQNADATEVLRHAAASEGEASNDPGPPLPPPETPDAEIEELRYRELFAQVLRAELRNFESGALVWAFADFRKNVRDDIRNEMAAACLRDTLAKNNRKTPWGPAPSLFPSDVDDEVDTQWESGPVRARCSGTVSRPCSQQWRPPPEKRPNSSSLGGGRQGTCPEMDAPCSVAKQDACVKIAFDGDCIRDSDKDETCSASRHSTPTEEFDCRNNTLSNLDTPRSEEAKVLPGVQRLEISGERKADAEDDDVSTNERFVLPGNPVVADAEHPVARKSPTASRYFAEVVADAEHPVARKSTASRYFAEALTNSQSHCDEDRSLDEDFEERKQLQRRNLRVFLGADRFSFLVPLVELLKGRSALADFVRSPVFDHLSGVVIVANAITIGIQTDWMARAGSDDVPGWLEVVDKLIACIFAIELCMRLWAYGCSFFWQPGVWKWNLFDFVMVLLQVFEELVRAVIALGFDAALDQFKIMRVMRVLRLVRIVRVVRIMRMVSELRTIVASVLGSLKALLWTVVLLLLFMYMVAVYFTQTVTDFRLEENESIYASDFQEGFGGLVVTWLSLYQAISGGVDWADLSAPLFEHISPLVGGIFVLYVAFSVLCILNVVTGVFVESALKNAQSEEDVFMERNLTNIFETTDLNSNGTLEWEEFDAAINTQEMREFLQSIEVDPNEAIKLFRLIDVEERNQVTLTEYVTQCCRLRGQARSVDLMTVLFEVRHFARTFLQHSTDAERRLALCEDLLKKVAVIS